MSDQHAAPTLADARSRAAAAAVALRGPAVPTPPRRAVGRVLAEPVLSRTPIPHAATSAMDGWAVAGSGPWRLRPAEAAPSPAQPPASPAPGEAVAVVTGSPIPAGADSVLRAEHGTVRAEDGEDRLHADPTTGDLAAGRHIRPAGAEAAAGETLLAAGSVVTPAAAAVAAVAGHDLLPVRPAPQVTLICTGEEVITAGLPGPGQVRDAFEVSVPAAVEAMGGRTAAVRRIGDAVEPLVEALAAAAHGEERPGEATDAEHAAPRLILTTGGTAGSAADALHPALEQLGAELLVDGIAMRPGHPTVLARLGDSLVVGMPGNPLAGFAALLGLGGVVLDGLAGHERPEDRRLGAGRAAEELPGARRGTRLLPVILDRTGVVPAGRDGSAMLRGLAAADALAEVPAGGVAAGSPARLHLLPWIADRGEAAWDA